MSKQINKIINLENVSISFLNKFILQNVFLDIYQGEFCFLTGRTGSGKSSLLKLLYSDLPVKHGRGYVASFKLHEMKVMQVPLLRRRLGVVFQDFQLLIDRNVEENLLFVLKSTGWSNTKSIKLRIYEVLMKVGMAWAIKKFPYQLSGGEQQRIVIARALLNDPIILLADEPTGNLDSVVAESVLNLFLDINKGGTAVLMATHNDYFVRKYSDKKIYECQDGKLLLKTGAIY